MVRVTLEADPENEKTMFIVFIYQNYLNYAFKHFFVSDTRKIFNSLFYDHISLVKWYKKNEKFK